MLVGAGLCRLVFDLAWCPRSWTGLRRLATASDWLRDPGRLKIRSEVPSGCFDLKNVGVDAFVWSAGGSGSQRQESPVAAVAGADRRQELLPSGSPPSGPVMGGVAMADPEGNEFAWSAVRPSGFAVEVLQWTAEHLAVGEVVVAGAQERLDHADVVGVAVAADLQRPGVDKDSRSAGHDGGGVAVTASGRCDRDQADDRGAGVWAGRLYAGPHFHDCV